jgi:antitoxin (DNA-binding transcriptional repressor) of toxin-antitoxin stability system
VTTTIDITTVQEVRDLLSLLETDKEIILTNANTPVAKLAAIPQVYPPKDGRIADMHPNIWVSDDFDEPVPEQYWNSRKL